MASTRLERLISSQAGLSRSQARVVIRRGRVAVNGVAERDPGKPVPDGAALLLDGRPVLAPPRLALFHKAVGVQCTVGDPQGRPNLEDVAAELLAMGLHPVGRLDADTSGLLPFSAEGGWTQHLLHPRHGVEKRYRARVEGQLGPELGQRLAAGVETALGVHRARLDRIDGDVVELTVTEGKHRMVRRMLNNCGHPVIDLHRLRFGALSLDGLALGAWRAASPEELQWASALR